MCNTTTANLLVDEKLIELGFVYNEYKDDNDDVVSADWSFKNDNFEITINCWGEVHLERVNIIADSISIKVSDLYDLQILTDWIS